VEEGVVERQALVVRMEQMEVELKEREDEARAKVMELDAAVEQRKRLEEESKIRIQQEVSRPDQDKVKEYVEQIKLLEGEVLSAKNSVQGKDTEIAELQKNLMNQERMVEDGRTTAAAMTVRLEEIKVEVAKKTQELEAKTVAFVAMERSLEDAKESIKYASSNDNIIKGLETLLRRKDATIEELETNAKDSKEKVQGNQREINDERYDLERQRDALKEELDSVREKVRMEVTKDMVEVKSKAENEKINIQLNMDSSLKAKDEVIKALKTEIKAYELERQSLRKLVELSFERFVFLFNQAY